MDVAPAWPGACCMAYWGVALQQGSLSEVMHLSKLFVWATVAEQTQKWMPVNLLWDYKLHWRDAGWARRLPSPPPSPSLRLDRCPPPPFTSTTLLPHCSCPPPPCTSPASHPLPTLHLVNPDLLCHAAQDYGNSVSLSSYMMLLVEQYFVLDPKQIRWIEGNRFHLTVPRVEVHGVSGWPASKGGGEVRSSIPGVRCGGYRHDQQVEV